MPGKASMLADASVAVRNSASRRLINSVIRVPDAAWIPLILTTLGAVYASVLRANGCDGSDPGRGHYPASSRGEQARTAARLSRLPMRKCYDTRRQDRDWDWR